MSTVFYLLKAIVLAIIMFFSLRFLGFSTQPALIFSLVPLVLGILSVFTSFAYGLTGLVFILACGSALFPDWQNKAKELMSVVEQQPTAANTVKTK